MRDVLTKAKALLKEYSLCDRCLGRQFANLSTGLSNLTRGRSIKVLLALEASQGEGDLSALRYLARTGFKPALLALEKMGLAPPKREACYVCHGLFGRLDGLVNKALKLLEGYEFKTFLVGSRLPKEVLEREEELRRRFSLAEGESIKREVNRLVGKKLAKVTGKDVDFRDPDVTIILDIEKMEVEVEVKPLFVYGRYRKLMRGLAQSRGKGGERSVESIIGEVIRRKVDGEEFRLHGAGREDLDVRTLGPGRPFILEVLRPRTRTIDLDEVEGLINSVALGKVEVHGLRLARREDVSRLKALSQYLYKTYRALVEFDAPFEAERLKAVEEEFNNIVVRQRTPLRVLHRRKDKVRVKKVYYVKAYPRGERKAEFIIKCQGGLYVKELITGDEGRTRPNISETIGRNVVRMELDIIDIEGLE